MVQEVLNLRINTGRSSVYYPNLRPIIVQTQVDIDVTISVDPNTQETIIAISSLPDVDPSIFPVVTTPTLTSDNFLLVEAGQIIQVPESVIATINVASATKLASAFLLTASGAINGSVSIDGSGNVTLASSLNSLTRNLDFSGFTGVNLANPTNSQDIATKFYVDMVAQSLQPKPAADWATTQALPSNTYNNGTAGVGATLIAQAVGALAIDGGSPIAGQLLLVKNEANGSQNGLYLIDTPGSVSTAYHLTRSIDMDAATKYTGALIAVENGTTNRNTLWLANFSGTPFVPGTTPLSFANLTAANAYIFGTGLNLSGTTVTVVYGNTTGTALSGSLYGTPSGVATLDGSGLLPAAQLPLSGAVAGTYNTVTVNNKGVVTGGSNAAYLLSVTLTGDITGTGTSTISTTLANSGVTSGAYSKVTVNSKGLVTLGGSAALNSDLSDVLISSIANNNMLSYNSSSGKWVNIAPPYDMGGGYIGKPASAQVLWRFVFPRSAVLPQNLTGSVAACSIGPAGAITLPILKNAVSLGTINFATNATSGTFTFASQTSFAAGDVLEVDASAVADNNFSSPSWTFAGTRS